MEIFVFILEISFCFFLKCLQSIYYNDFFVTEHDAILHIHYNSYGYIRRKNGR